MSYNTILAAAAVAVMGVGSAQAATIVDPAEELGGLIWDFGGLDGGDDYVSSKALDVATDLPKGIEFSVTPTTGTLSIEINNSGFEAIVLGVSNLLCLGGCETGTYTLSYAGTDLYTVISGAPQFLNTFTVATGSEESLVWSWNLPEDAVFGQVSTNVEVVPLPAAGWMLLAGVGGIAALRRRKTA